MASSSLGKSSFELLKLSNVLLLSSPSPAQTSRIALSQLVLTRGIKMYEEPPKFPVKNFPSRHRLPIMPKVPQMWAVTPVKPPKLPKELHRQMGEEQTHNKLVLGQYGIVAITGGRLRHQTFEALRNNISRKLEADKSFAIYRVDPPSLPVTLKGSGKKHGGGKAGIHHYVTPIRAGRVILEVGGDVLWEEVQPWLSPISKMLPFEAIAVNQSLLDRLNEEEKRLEAANQNPISFEWLIRNNIRDCQRFTSPWDHKWFGKFVYKDRTLNKKWNIIRKSKYPNK